MNRSMRICLNVKMDTFQLELIDENEHFLSFYYDILPLYFIFLF